MIDRLGERIAEEQEPAVLDINVRALVTALEVGGETGNFAIRDAALRAIVESCGARVRSLTPQQVELLAPVLKGAQAVRTQLQALRINPPFERESVRESGGFCGDMIAFVFRTVRARVLPVGTENAPDGDGAAKRNICATALALAQSTIPLAKDKLGAGDPNGTVPALDELVRRGSREGDDQFLQDALEVIGDGGILTRDGFNFNANRFLK
jgi:hypothetical protein